jgi:hypothetical protein
VPAAAAPAAQAVDDLDDDAIDLEALAEAEKDEPDAPLAAPVRHPRCARRTTLKQNPND